MRLIIYKPCSNSLRHKINIYKGCLSKNNKLYKKSITFFNKTGGRSTKTGHITSWHRGGGNKKLFRKINFSNLRFFSIILFVMYDPYRKSFITLNFEIKKKNFFRCLATNNVYPGCFSSCTDLNLEKNLGNRSKLLNIPAGSYIHSLSMGINSFSKYIRSAGTCGQLIESIKNKSKIKLPSGKFIYVSSDSYATIGTLSNIFHKSIVLGKAGAKRILGRRPIVRGIAMNPVDHPHGGRTNGGRPSVTPWGLPTKGKFYLKAKKK